MDCLRIAVVLPVRKTFSYAVPDDLIDRAQVGCRVIVPFRNRNAIGYILERNPQTHGKVLKEIGDVLDQDPLFHQSLVPFFQWMADYYLYPIGRVIQSAVPVDQGAYRFARLTEEGLKVLDALSGPADEMELLSWIRKNPEKKLSSSLGQAGALQKKGWLIIECRIGKSSVGPMMRRFVRPRAGVDLDSLVEERESGEGNAKREREFLNTVFGANGMAQSTLYARFFNGPSLVRKWIKKGAIERYDAPVLRTPAGKIILPSPVPPELYERQRETLHTVKRHLNRKSFAAFLLHGVTGSGKTEVYYGAVKHVIEQGRQAILMVPEIALAIYLEGLFRTRLGDRIAIYHSGLSKGERYDQWLRMARGEVSLVIGARSALFAPFPRLGLIIVDEEHDFSYKQEDSLRYQARDAAVVRGKLEKALVMLGSGTPSIQSYHNTLTGRYRLLSMPDRIERRPLPKVEMLDMKTVPEDAKRKGILSPLLKEALAANLASRKQAILFLNRRGFSRVYLCRSCGKPIRCRNCDLALTYHHEEKSLTCHYCGFNLRPQKRCPACGQEGMRPFGFGTERLEQELGEIFPKARIARMDRDSTRRKGEALNILKRFGENEIDILVGTQMITKGYDFPNVTLVGVIAADLSLGFPDFRAGERTFQILSQVAGRAGRGEQRGRVIVQTFNPEHYALVTAKEHDFESFFQKEKALREQLGYPPFSYMACLRFKGNHKERTSERVRLVGREIRGILENWPKRGKEIQALGPIEAPLAKLKGKYRFQILIKSKGAELLHFFLREVEGRAARVLRGSGVGLTVDVDPYQML